MSRRARAGATPAASRRSNVHALVKHSEAFVWRGAGRVQDHNAKFLRLPT
jgi:hypothetical protein